MNINKLSILELKALYYDLLVEAQNARHIMNQIDQRIIQLQNQQVAEEPEAQTPDE